MLSYTEVKLDKVAHGIVDVKAPPLETFEKLLLQKGWSVEDPDLEKLYYSYKDMVYRFCVHVRVPGSDTKILPDHHTAHRNLEPVKKEKSIIQSQGVLRYIQLAQDEVTQCLGVVQAYFEPVLFRLHSYIPRQVLISGEGCIKTVSKYMPANPDSGKAPHEFQDKVRFYLTSRYYQSLTLAWICTLVLFVSPPIIGRKGLFKLGQEITMLDVIRTMIPCGKDPRTGKTDSKCLVATTNAYWVMFSTFKVHAMKLVVALCCTTFGGAIFSRYVMSASLIALVIVMWMVSATIEGPLQLLTVLSVASSIRYVV